MTPSGSKTAPVHADWRYTISDAQSPHNLAEDAVAEWIERAVAEPPIDALSDAELVSACDSELPSTVRAKLSELLAENREGPLIAAGRPNRRFVEAASARAWRTRSLGSSRGDDFAHGRRNVCVESVPAHFHYDLGPQCGERVRQREGVEVILQDVGSREKPAHDCVAGVAVIPGAHRYFGNVRDGDGVICLVGLRNNVVRTDNGNQGGRAIGWCKQVGRAPTPTVELTAGAERAGWVRSSRCSTLKWFACAKRLADESGQSWMTFRRWISQSSLNCLSVSLTV